jgi:RNA polymerase sigma-70 factor (ECF subfamily)
MGRTTLSESLNALLPRCRRGDEEAFVEVYRLVGSSLFGTAVRMLGRPEEAEEVVQETLVRLYEKAATIRAGNLRSWMHRVTVNQCLDRIKSKGRQTEELPAEIPANAGADGPVSRMDLSRAVATLPLQARKVFLLHDLEGFKHREVAETLGITEGTSKSQLFRAREMLRRRLAGTLEVSA